MLTRRKPPAFLPSMSKPVPAEKMMRAEVGATTLKRFYRLRPALGWPPKAQFTTAAVRFAAEMAEARRVRLENGKFVEVQK